MKAACMVEQRGDSGNLHVLREHSDLYNNLWKDDGIVLYNCFLGIIWYDA